MKDPADYLLPFKIILGLFCLIAVLLISTTIAYFTAENSFQTNTQLIILERDLCNSNLNAMEQLLTRSMNQTKYCLGELKAAYNQTGRCVEQLQLCRGY
jgi:CHASE1-domain containing sensor protein